MGDAGDGRRMLVVVPTYNERDNLPALAGALRGVIPDADLLVVDDASPDGTGAVAETLAAARPRAIQVLHRNRRQGQGTAYLAAFRHALRLPYDTIVQMDCDLSHDPASVPDLIGALAAGADLVLGSRYVPGGETDNWPLGRRLLSRFANAYARAVLGLPYRDLTGGFKAWRRSMLEMIPLDQVWANSNGFHIEMTYRAHRLGAHIRELPISFVDRRLGASKMSHAAIWESILLCWRLRFGV